MRLKYECPMIEISDYNSDDLTYIVKLAKNLDVALTIHLDKIITVYGTKVELDKFITRFRLVFCMKEV